MTGVSAAAVAQAVERAVISPAQAEALAAIERELAPVAPSIDDEQLRFVSGFADIFVTIGILLFVGALAAIMGSTGSTPALAGIAASTWLLAEFFTGKRRMALPSIVLLVLFVAAVLVLSLQVFTQLLPATRPLPERLFFLPSEDAGALALAALATVGLAALHYVRFRVPITVAAGAAALCVVALGVAAAAVPDLSDGSVNAVLFVCGAGVFALAMRFDVSDPERLTRRADIAFWLHLLAAPLIVHPLIRGLLVHGSDAELTTAAAVGVLWLFVALGAVAVTIDRRAILVSGLVYAGIAFRSLLGGTGLSGDHRLPAVLLALGAFILLVSAGWQPLRRAILRRLPSALARRLPHPMLVTP